MPVHKQCERCATSYTCRPSKAAERKYCTAKCANDANRKYANPTWKDYATAWRANKGDAHVKRAEATQFATFYATVHGRAVHMLNNARARAKRYGVKCELTTAWIEDRLNIGACSITGIAFVFQANGGRGHVTNSFSPSIDRIDQAGDYTEENCRMTCWIYNRARGAFPPDDFDRMIQALAP